jgi:transposase
MAAAPSIVSDELWGPVEPLLPVKARRFRYPFARRERNDRDADATSADVIGLTAFRRR